MRGDYGGFGDGHGGDYASGAGYGGADPAARPWSDDAQRTPSSLARQDQPSDRHDVFEAWLETVVFLPEDTEAVPLPQAPTTTTPASLPAAPLTFGLTPHPADFDNVTTPLSSSSAGPRRLSTRRFAAVLAASAAAAAAVIWSVTPSVTWEGKVPFSAPVAAALPPDINANLATSLLGGTQPVVSARDSTLTIRWTRPLDPTLYDNTAQQITAWLAAARNASGAGVSRDVTLPALRSQQVAALAEIASVWKTALRQATGDLLHPATRSAALGQPSLPILPDGAAYSQAITGRDSAAARLGSLQAAITQASLSPQAAFEAATRHLQESIASARTQSAEDPTLAAFTRAIADFSEQSRQLADELLARRTEQVDRLQQLRKRLDDRMRIRQDKAWDADTELAKLGAELGNSTRRLEAARQSGAEHAASELAAEVQYLQGMIEARKSVLGIDPGDRRAVAEVQSLIDEATAAAAADRAAAESRLALQRKHLDEMVTDSLGAARRHQADELRQRLDAVEVARRALTTPAALPGTITQSADLAAIKAELQTAQAAVDHMNGQIMAHLVARFARHGGHEAATPDLAYTLDVRAALRPIAMAVDTTLTEARAFATLSRQIAHREGRAAAQVAPPAVGIVGRTDPRGTWALAAFGVVLGLGRLTLARRDATQPHTDAATSPA